MANNINRKDKKNTKPTNNGRQYFNLDEDKAIFEEVDEELRNEKFKQLINKYGGLIFSILILALTITIGYEKIAEWKVRKAEQSNIKYTQAINPNSNYENNIAELENIVHTETGLYKDMAQLQIANILIDNNQKEKGVEVLEKISNDTSVTEKIREIAIIKLATFKIDSVSYDELNNLLQNIANGNGAWSSMAKELLAMSAVYNKDFETAKNIYNDLLSSEISDDFKARINDMLALLNEAN
ncbi:MAG: tetratricopeptide repeat protein [Alphaproteobacteria bacterium]|nr:tetratricopeptide repeat protein [Alphaproteobacteria bacterium]